MPLLRNINPLGAIDLPLIGRTLEAGEEFEVSDDLAGHAPSGTPGEDDWHPGVGLLGQSVNFVLVDGPEDVDAMTAPELRDYADRHDIDLDGAMKKADLLATVKAAEAEQVENHDENDPGHVLDEPSGPATDDDPQES